MYSFDKIKYKETIESIANQLQKVEQDISYKRFNALTTDLVQRTKNIEPYFCDNNNFSRVLLLRTVIDLNLNLQDITSLLLQALELHKNNLLVLKQELQNLSTEIFAYRCEVFAAVKETDEERCNGIDYAHESIQLGLRCNSMLCQVDKLFDTLEVKISELNHCKMQLLDICKSLYSIKRYLISKNKLKGYIENMGVCFNSLLNFINEFIIFANN